MIAIVILNHNNASDTLECIASLPKLDETQCRVFVIDNASTDNSVQAIEQTEPRVTVVRSSVNRGFAGGMNLGIRHVQQFNADLLLLLNNDIVLAADAIAELTDAAEHYPGAGILVPKIYYASMPTTIWSAGAVWRRFPPRVTIRGFNIPDGPEYDQPIPLDYATGCALLIRRPVFDQVGFFDEGFFMYQEDYDFCYRSRQAGWTIRYVPTAKIWHKVSRSLGSRSPQWWYYWSRSATRLYHHTWDYSWLAVIAMLSYFALRELTKGHARFLRPMVAGVRDEVRALRTAEYRA
jgi:GT2 family glycosyltransferase